jgi:hypothetical protein
MGWGPFSANEFRCNGNQITARRNILSTHATLHSMSGGEYPLYFAHKKKAPRCRRAFP